MISLNLKHLSTIQSTHGLSPLDLLPKTEDILRDTASLQKKEQGFIDILDDEKTIRSIQKFASGVKNKYSHIVILGIGGSALGATALHDALKLKVKKQPKLVVLDNIDPAMIAEAEKELPLKKTLFLVITKSGTTPETLAQYFFFQKKLAAAKLPLVKHIVVITDEHAGFMREEVQRLKLPSFSIPQNVGGRFSLFTAVGLLPAALLQYNIKELIHGAKTMRKLFLSPNPLQNLPYQFAHLQAALYKKQKNIHVLMVYSQQLLRLGDWYRQLLGESIGKKSQQNKESVGLTPLTALGVTDQHSQIQLFNDGPNDKIFTILHTEKSLVDQKIPVVSKHEHVQFLRGASFASLFNAERKATTDALVENDRPVISLGIDYISPFSFGELIFFFETSVAYLGELLGVNAFDQPGVERGKVLTKKYLKN